MIAAAIKRVAPTPTPTPTPMAVLLSLLFEDAAGVELPLAVAEAVLAVLLVTKAVLLVSGAVLDCTPEPDCVDSLSVDDRKVSITRLGPDSHSGAPAVKSIDSSSQQ